MDLVAIPSFIPRSRQIIPCAERQAIIVASSIGAINGDEAMEIEKELRAYLTECRKAFDPCLMQPVPKLYRFAQ
jgi:predicted transcriptional regulator